MKHLISGTLILLTMLLNTSSVLALTVPSELYFCKTKVTFTPAGRARMQAEVDKLTRNLFYLNILVERADTYMPFVEEGLKFANAPSDLKYICLLESALVGDAVSPSNAVGFWQFKDFTAKEVGLRVDQKVDERKHIFRSSVGAARYFWMNYNRFGNWVYAVIAYNTGGTGALPFINDEYLRSNEMVVDEKLHFYAAKSIAYKLAFEDYLSQKRQPKVWLKPHSNEQVVDARQLASRHGMNYWEFLKYNLWVLQASLPDDRPFSYYVPSTGAPAVHVADPHTEVFKSEEDRGSFIFIPARPTPPPSPLTHFPPTQKPEPAVTTAKPGSPPPPMLSEKYRKAGQAPLDAQYFEIYKDPNYSREFMLLKPGQTLEDVAIDLNIPIKKLRKWNFLENDDNPKPQQLILLAPPNKLSQHVAVKFENLIEVGIKYGKDPQKLAELNGITSMSEMLVEGQKIYLREAKPQGEKIIIYTLSTDQKSQPAPTPAPVGAKNLSPQPEPASPVPVGTKNLSPQPEPAGPAPAGAKNLSPQPESGPPKVETPITTEVYFVRQGDNLFSIARRANTSAAAIRSLNALSSDQLQIGQKLRIPGR